ncbi:MAG: hypothetical protein FWE95_03640 [Planctomycetaceae bacterium]|nr:hypothetical protein [Planctomycetaceae bacterium]
MLFSNCKRRVPEYRLNNPVAPRCFAFGFHVFADCIDESRGDNIGASGIYPAVDPLASSSRVLDPQYVGRQHYDCARVWSSGRCNVSRNRNLHEPKSGTALAPGSLRESRPSEIGGLAPTPVPSPTRISF